MQRIFYKKRPEANSVRIGTRFRGLLTITSLHLEQEKKRLFGLLILKLCFDLFNEDFLTHLRTR